MRGKRILIADDETNIRTVLELLFESEGYRIDCVADGDGAWRLLQSGEDYGLVISDLRMKGLDGISLLSRMRESGIGTPFVLMTAYGTVETAVDAMKLGAVDVVTKPFAKKLMLGIAERIFRVSHLEDENLRLAQKFPARGQAEDELVTASASMKEIADLLQRIATVTAPVLISGESGTGKEVVARAIHRAYSGGDFDSRPFVSVNCPAVPEQLLESELFGYRKGAFTGADRDFKGRVALADGGTLFFDEIGDLPASIQPKLLRVLEARTIEPLGSGLSRKVDIRVVCATNRDLDALVREGRFRLDLLYRINTFTIEIPPLRRRLEDIPVLASGFLGRFARDLRKEVRSFDPEVLGLFASYSWPGNIRELRNIVERAVVLCAGESIGVGDIPRELTHPGSCADARSAPGGREGEKRRPTLEDAELSMLREALELAGGNVSEAARRLGITRNTMRYRMRKYSLEE
jgi:DNA-binding NtrC family response regulator